MRNPTRDNAFKHQADITRRATIIERHLTIPRGGDTAVLKQVWWGSGPPASALGNLGDTYIDNADPDIYYLYGPKTGEGWGAGFPLSSGGLPQRRTVSFTTELLDPDESDELEIELFSQERVLQVRADWPCRIRTYCSPDQRTSDAARSILLDPERESDHGLMLEVSLGTTAEGVILQSLDLSPVVTIFNDVDENIAYASVTNHDLSPRAITATIVTTRSE